MRICSESCAVTGSLRISRNARLGGNYSTNKKEDRLVREMRELAKCRSWPRGTAIPVKFWMHLNLNFGTVYAVMCFSVICSNLECDMTEYKWYSKTLLFPCMIFFFFLVTVSCARSALVSERLLSWNDLQPYHTQAGSRSLFWFAARHQLLH